MQRPIGHDWKPVQSPGTGPITPEQQALADLARLDNRLRLRFLERGLSQPETAERLARCSGPVIKAVVGEDPETRETVRDLALGTLRKEDADWRLRVASTCLALSLGESMPEYAREGALALVEGIDRIGGGTMDKARVDDANSYSTLLEVLARHLSASDARDVGRTAARDVGRTALNRAPGSPDSGVLRLLCKAIATLAARMEAAEAARVCADAARPLVQALLMKRVKGDELAHLAPYMEPADALDAATRLAQAISKKTNEPYDRFLLAAGIASLAQRIPDADAARVCRAAAAPLIQDIPKGTVIDGFYARLVGTLGQRMDPAEAAKLCADVVPPLIEAILKETDSLRLTLLTQEVELLAPCMAAAAARDAATSLSPAIRKKAAIGDRTSLAQAVAALAQRMDAAEAAKVCADAATPLVEYFPRAAQHEVSSLAKAVGLLAGRMDPGARTKLCAAIVPSLLRTASREKGVFAVPELAEAVVSLAPYMAAADSTKVTATTAAALLDSFDLYFKAQAQSEASLPDNLTRGTTPFESRIFRTFAALAMRMAPPDVADLLTRHKLTPVATDGILRELGSVAGRRFQTIDQAVRWFRDRDPAPQKP